jgi:hypothetical protein
MARYDDDWYMPKGCILDPGPTAQIDEWQAHLARLEAMPRDGWIERKIARTKDIIAAISERNRKG